MSKAYPKCKKTKNIISLGYKKDFFINLKGDVLDNNSQILKYIERYLMRPAIAEYKITKFEENQVTFWYIDVATKEKIFLTLPLFKFISRLILHINPKGFKVIRRCGFYTRNIKANLKSQIRCFFKENSFKEAYFLSSFLHTFFYSFFLKFFSLRKILYFFTKL
ncbi:transposase [Psychrilyobacter sp.]|uniref:transposase n=1 Tax=Psychrilyobacter sp. TaxID=2586924 RepID=UPI003C71FC32